jgi:SAM-dependent methyltransferase
MKNVTVQDSLLSEQAQTLLGEQGREWSRHAARYADYFLDPFRPGVVNPALDFLEDVPQSRSKTIADLGCGTGPLLPWLLERFGQVVALDFAKGMLAQARARLKGEARRIRFLIRPMDQLDDLCGSLDVAVAFNSIVTADERVIDRTLVAIRRSLKPDGVFVGVLPAMDAIHYHTMLLLDQALDRGDSIEQAFRHASTLGEHDYYEFAFSRFAFMGLRQKFWFPFEIEYRLAKAGFCQVELRKVLYPWDDQLVGSTQFANKPQSWDWAFRARPHPAPATHGRSL